jgi:NhaP-type Na+/H+ or K+/H+ antiporter
VLNLWFVIVGALLILMGLVGSVTDRLPLTPALIYLLLGIALGPAGVGVLQIDPVRDAELLEHVFEVAVLISLFTVGLKLRLPFSDPLWRIAVRLAVLSMLFTIAMVAVGGVYLLGLPLGAAVLLGAMLAPTDPVLASDVQVKRLDERDRVRFGLTAEGGMNDGTAFPFVFLGLGLLSVRETGPFFLQWVAVDLVWGVAGGLCIGWVCGIAMTRLVSWLRKKMQEPIGLAEFLILGLIALSYGLALLAQALGFLAVLAAGLAVRRIEVVETRRAEHAAPSTNAQVGSQKAPAGTMARSLLALNEQLERMAELVAVLLLGSLLSAGYFSVEGLALALAVLLVVRPVSVLLGLVGLGSSPRQLALISWFGIRGVGSLYYLAFVMSSGLAAPLTQRLLPLVVSVVAVSIVVHGISATPLMDLYGRRRRDGRA